MNGKKVVNAMKRHALGAALIILALVAINGYAQSTRGGKLSGLYEQLEKVSTYRVERKADLARLIDRATDKELCVLRQEGPETIAVSSVIAQIDLANASIATQARRTISSYNVSLSVGTLLLNENTGTVSMIHYVSPRLVSASEMVQLIDHFSRVSRSAAGEFSAMARR